VQFGDHLRRVEIVRKRVQHAAAEGEPHPRARRHTSGRASSRSPPGPARSSPAAAGSGCGAC
jgi:hypothetical protein